MAFTRSRSKDRDSVRRPAVDRPRRRLQVFALLIAGGFGALAFVSWWTGRENLREGSRVVSRGGPALAIGKIPTTYHAVYRVENRAGRELVVTTEKMWVRRPFSSRIESWRGAPPGSRRLTVRHSSFGVLTNVGERSAPLNITVPPSLASGDVRVDAALAEAVRDKTVWRRERREVYGRLCQVYRAGGPVFAGDLTPYEPGAGEFADVCVDRNGIVLEEAWTSRGRLIQRRVATELEVDEPINPELLKIDVPEQEGIERGAVERLRPGPGTGLWVLDGLPKGFELLGRYGVVISPSTIPRFGQLEPPVAPVSTSDVYVRGPDLLVIDQDPSLHVLTSRDSRRERAIELENFEEAKLIVDARMSEVRGQDPDGSIVRVYGTLPPSLLVDLARTLRQAR